MTEVRTIARQIQQLEIYLNNLVSALTRGELPVNLQPITQIFDSTIKSLTPVLNLSEDRFIDIYNDIPQLLTAYAVDVTLSEDSYRSVDNNITFNRFHRGNYWIITSADSIDKAWLVPDPLKNLSLDRMPSLAASFDRDIIDQNRDHNFHTYFLVTPALVQILPIVEPLTWKLLERGKITNSQIQKSTAITDAIEDIHEQLARNRYRQDKLVHGQDILSKESEKVKDIIILQDKKNISLKFQVESLELNTKIELHTQLEELKSRSKYDELRLSERLCRQRDDTDRLQKTITKILTDIEEIRTDLAIKGISVNQDISHLKQKPKLVGQKLRSAKSELSIQQDESLSPAAPMLTQIEQEILSEYHHNIDKFAEKYQVKNVDLTKALIRANLACEKKNVVVEKVDQGKYWLFNLEDNIYLVPAKERYLDKNIYADTNTIFERQNYTPDYQKIQLIKPAIVSINPNTNPQTWRLQQQGELAFS